MMSSNNINNKNVDNIFDFIFENKILSIRSFTDINFDIWFVGKDIAKYLGYKKTENAITNHVDMEDKMSFLEFKERNNILENIDSRLILINESGLYSLTVSSKLESAKKFKRWITSEVIPSIRKTGMYKIIKEKDDEIKDLKQLLQNIENQNNHLINQNNQIINQNNVLENKIDVITEHVVDNSDRANLKEQFLIVKILDTPIDDKFQYHIIRAQKRNINRALDDLRLKYKIDDIMNRIVLRINYIPNSVMFKNKMRDVIENIYIKSYLNEFNLINNCTIEELKNKIHDINNERYN